MKETTDVPVTLINTGKPYLDYIDLTGKNPDLSSQLRQIDLSSLKQ